MLQAPELQGEFQRWACCRHQEGHHQQRALGISAGTDTSSRGWETLLKNCPQVGGRDLPKLPSGSTSLNWWKMAKIYFLSFLPGFSRSERRPRTQGRVWRPCKFLWPTPSTLTVFFFMESFPFLQKGWVGFVYMDILQFGGKMGCFSFPCSLSESQGTCKPILGGNVGAGLTACFLAHFYQWDGEVGILLSTPTESGARLSVRGSLWT